MKVLPESVRIAMARGDIETLRQLGQHGAAKANLAKARAKESARKQVQAAEKYDCVDSLLAAEREREVWADAYAHAQRNRIGWLDES